MFDSVLVANRGEIAVRVIRACHDLGLRAVAVYSDADRESRHVALADAAVRIGEASPADSYLNIERILGAARESGAGAVHPGYGFLSENAGLARAVTDAGLTFIGPPATAIEVMGDKVAARRAAVEAGVPVVPGSDGALADAEAAVAFARQHGFPLALKALHGGGGRGMRIVRAPGELPVAFEAAVREATLAFGRGDCYAERYLERPRHIEVQILADHRGTVLALGDRDCSVQRRHQKLIEEAPAPGLDPAVRRAIADAAVRLARHVGYTNAGTCEFLLDTDGRTFYFLEMNTRLQVEHPVTEQVTGIDLVTEQIRVAGGMPLGRVQRDVTVTGHAVEVRINAEDPAESFAPRSGKVHALTPPLGPWVRFDTGLEAGQEISPYYDSLIGKLVTWGANRDQALHRMARALDEFQLAGPATTLPFHRLALAHPQFVRAEHSTVSVESEWDLSDLEPAETGDVTVQPEAAPRRDVRLPLGDRVFTITITGTAHDAARASSARRRQSGATATRTDRPAAETPELRSPIQGVVSRLDAKDGDEVRPGDPICVVEAMKMENVVVAHRSGRLTLTRKAGEGVEHRAVLAVIEP
ncbi:acetyl-CoA carboxylase biotin carboxylase subunit [Amycolatopsis sp. K13G38]|uniref:biotin carboxylase n=1 Tax=Amycolatopsis acididurans TaxID=2724524 RepID=A0ABX1JGT7_9PSEU|nr:acetyl-CoA carboxylase biotin carboxylase subunit [Amycolatopsis acididurans]NKQ58044.1 acetyl-CoA carboxylase biotin carboxylase subunit [Amycolatopsis acididurans]